MYPTILALLLLASCAAQMPPPAPLARSARPPTFTAAEPPPLAPPPAPAARSRDAWQGTRWGMIKSEIHAVVPQAVDWMQSYGTPQTFPRFGMQTYTVQGTCQEEVSFSFKDGGLNHVFVTAKDNSLLPDSPLRCSLIVERALLARYGQPTNSGTSHTGAMSDRMVVWDTSGSLVTFSLSQSPSLRNADGSPAIFYYTTVDYRPHLTRLEDTY